MSRENNAPIQDAPQTCTPKGHCWKYTLLPALILGLLAAGILAYVCSPQYAATAVIQVRTIKSTIFIPETPQSLYAHNIFVNTQIALMKSPRVLDKALENSDVAQLPVILKQKDQRAWLARKLQIQQIRRSELITVSIRTNSEQASEIIVNAVVDTYLQFIGNDAKETGNALLSSLRREEGRQQRQVQRLQESILAKTKQAAQADAAAGTNPGRDPVDLLMREAALAEIKLIAMKAQRTAVLERMEQPDAIPAAVLRQLFPEISSELQEFKAERAVRVQQREHAEQLLRPGDSDPRIKNIDQLIAQLDEKIKTLETDDDNSAVKAMRDAFRLRETAALFQLEQEIRAQEILVLELTKVYREQAAGMAEPVAAGEFEREQIERTNKILDKIGDRIQVLTAEQRAPGQVTLLSKTVVSKQPCRGTQVATAGLGFVAVFGLTLLCAFCCRHCCCCKRLAARQ